MLPTASSREEGARFFSKLMKIATRIEDADLAHGFVAPIGARRLACRPIRRALATLVDRHGVAWGKELFASWTEDASWRTPDWLPHLADICQDLVASDLTPSRSLAEWLLERETKAARERSTTALKRGEAWLSMDEFVNEAEGLAHALAAAAAMDVATVVDDEASFLMRKKPAFPLSFRITALQRCLARSPALRDALADSKLHHGVIEDLGVILAEPPRESNDWSIEHRFHCRCGDCTQLERLLRSGRTDYDWPLNKERRRHIHGAIDSSGLPVRHATLRRGSPYVLQLRKDRNLFSREADHRKKLKAILKGLEAASRGDAAAV